MNKEVLTFYFQGSLGQIYRSCFVERLLSIYLTVNVKILIPS